MGKIKILLIDDEADFLEIMAEKIESWGYGLIKASSGKQGIDKLRAEKPDIVILDYIMPGIDGISTLKEIRKIDKKIPVIMFTAHPELKAIKGTEKLGVSAFVPKLSTHSDAEVNLKSAVNMIEGEIKRKVSCPPRRN